MNKVFALSKKEHTFFSGRLTEKSFASMGIELSKLDQTKRIFFPKKLDHYSYTFLRGKTTIIWLIEKLIFLGNEQADSSMNPNYYCYELLIRPYHLQLDSDISKLV